MKLLWDSWVFICFWVCNLYNPYTKTQCLGCGLIRSVSVYQFTQMAKNHVRHTGRYQPSTEPTYKNERDRYHERGGGGCIFYTGIFVLVKIMTMSWHPFYVMWQILSGNGHLMKIWARKGDSLSVPVGLTGGQTWPANKYDALHQPF